MRGAGSSRERPYRVAALLSHPIQYFSPLFRYLSSDPQLDLTVFFCAPGATGEAFDRGFNRALKWDVPLLEGFKYRVLPNWTGHKLPKGFFSLINPSIIPALFRGRFDALWVHGHDAPTILFAILTARLKGIPVLMRAETHLLLPRSAGKRWLRQQLMPRFYGLCSAFLAIGTLNAEFYRSLGIRDSRIVLMPYCVDNAYFKLRGARDSASSALRSKYGLPSELPLIVYAAKLQSHKRALDLIEAFVRLRAAGLRAALVLIGSGEMEAPLRRRVSERHVSDVHWLGFRNQSEMPELLSLADVFVLPSEIEPWGLVINEAMCCGAPIVCSDAVGAAPDLVRDGWNGFVYPVGDVDALAGCLTRILSEPGLRDRMSANSRALVETWGFAECAAGLKQALAMTVPAAKLVPRDAGVWE